MLYRIWTIFVARTKEFYRDRSALGWNVIFPLLIIVGFSVVFRSDSSPILKVGIVALAEKPAENGISNIQFNEFLKIKYINFIQFNSKEKAIGSLQKFKIDMVIDSNSKTYWINESSPNGYLAEQLLKGAQNKSSVFKKQSFYNKGVQYVEWLFPGILGMNAMFNSLYGVGYVLVMYRKNGILKRFSVAPVRPFEFLSAQILSRMFVVLATTVVVYVGTVLLYGFKCKGSLFTLFILFALGSFCMISLGLLIASRSDSQEFADGIINIITWPMMFLSEVWFSLEGSRPWVQKVSQFLPLTHIVDGARMIMNEGATLFDLQLQIVYLVAISLLFLFLGSLLFRW
ncbi:MAG TPA: ABC transporter permease [Spirochaetota bacterium]|nr:ABC transporter permease [Spirochaetota bacterium]HOM87627.1 ABC transporter permease [Spirochaetota bacterium]HOR92647.1 ABC transporter permease [Spirochaetota bacterium]HOT18992.1 ABC transporter permease [Spirochaetota bacterium]HPD04114.1 ABC transporter permease [Spirochaetota bacterium]